MSENLMHTLAGAAIGLIFALILFYQF